MNSPASSQNTSYLVHLVDAVERLDPKPEALRERLIEGVRQVCEVERIPATLEQVCAAVDGSLVPVPVSSQANPMAAEDFGWNRPRTSDDRQQQCKWLTTGWRKIFAENGPYAALLGGGSVLLPFFMGLGIGFGAHSLFTGFAVTTALMALCPTISLSVAKRFDRRRAELEEVILSDAERAQLAAHGPSRRWIQRCLTSATPILMGKDMELIREHYRLEFENQERVRQKADETRRRQEMAAHFLAPHDRENAA